MSVNVSGMQMLYKFISTKIWIELDILEGHRSKFGGFLMAKSAKFKH